MQMTLPMETLATVIRLTRKSTTLPVELADALLAQEDLTNAFERLSTRQKNCYLDWIGGAAHTTERQVRSQLVASVVRTLADLATEAA